MGRNNIINETKDKNEAHDYKVYKYYKMKDGMLMCPDNFRRVDIVRVERCKYAYVITAKSGSIDPVLYVCDMDIEEIEEWGIDVFLNFVGGVYPEIQEIRDKEVAPIFSEDGKLLNAYEYAASDRIGVFKIKDVEDEEHLYCNCGIIRNKRRSLSLKENKK